MLPNSIQKLIDQFNKLPGIGPKTAQRLAFYLLKKPQHDLEEFAQSLTEAKKDLKTCNICLNISQHDPCLICSDPNRDNQTICVVTDHQNQQSIERTSEYQGTYHILGGVLNPLEGIGPDHLNIEQLINSRLLRQSISANEQKYIKTHLNINVQFKKILTYISD
jgi:recombination protein RecR